MKAFKAILLVAATATRPSAGFAPIPMRQHVATTVPSRLQSVRTSRSVWQPFDLSRGQILPHVATTVPSRLRSVRTGLGTATIAATAATTAAGAQDAVTGDVSAPTPPADDASEFTVRQATVADVPGIREARRGAFEVVNTRSKQMFLDAQGLIDGRYHSIVAIGAGGAVLGTVDLVVTEGERVATKNVYVRESHRRRCVGS